MYLMIVDYCNMSCSHCGMNCKKTGQDMSREVWEKAMQLGQDRGDNITIGGGEPCLHKNFKEILFDCIAKFEYVWMATNGSQTEISLALANLAKKGVLGVALSQDRYHDPIDPRVVQAFTKEGSKFRGEEDNDCREIRNVTGKEIISGRQKTGDRDCICSDLFVAPDGKIKACGCKNSIKLGTVFNPQIPDDYECGECYGSNRSNKKHLLEIISEETKEKQGHKELAETT